ncbi:hypothetical protein T484DRAFT_1881211 [Baffinella frigidus]|nr:hypothetical protein T484DRAFT_1881211 [Cryptophyta sp. CCMP2293]
MSSAPKKMSVGEIKEALTAVAIDFSHIFDKADLIELLQTHLQQQQDDTIQRAKTKANGAYARAGYPLALRYYNDALEAVTEDDSEVAAQLRSNMSLALSRLDQLEAARAAGETCVKHAPWFVKGYLRVGSVLARQTRHREAAAVFAKGLRVLDEQQGQGNDKVGPPPWCLSLPPAIVPRSISARGCERRPGAVAVSRAATARRHALKESLPALPPQMVVMMHQARSERRYGAVAVSRCATVHALRRLLIGG